MHSKSALLEKHFNTSVAKEAYEFMKSHADDPIPLSSWTKLQIPYHAPDHPVLPSIQEIEQAMKTEKFDRYSPVCRIDDLVVKRDSTGHAVQEAETLLYLRENSTVRVPELYAVLTSQESSGTVYYVVTEYIKGITLSGARVLSMSPASRAKLVASLCDQLRRLRATPAPDYYGHVHKQGWRPTLALIFGDNYTDMCGPYESYDAFAQAACLTAELTAAMCSCSMPDFAPEQVGALSAFRSTLASCAGQAPRFTHLDPALRNMIATPIGGSSEGDAHNWQITLIDWADAGWYPAYMQAVVLRQRMDMNTTEANMKERIEFCDNVLRELNEESYAEVEKVFWDLLELAHYQVM